MTPPVPADDPRRDVTIARPDDPELTHLSVVGDTEEMFTLLDGEVEVTFRGTTYLARAGETINVPANAPHQFRNVSGQPARLLCLCAPAGQEEFFAAIGDRVATRTAPPPDLDDATRAGRLTKAMELAPRYRTELLLP